MSNTWPPQQEPPPQTGWPQFHSPSQPPSREAAEYGHGRYGTPGPPSAGRPGGRPPQEGAPWWEWGEAPAPEQYQPGQPPPYYPEYPQAPHGAPYPYGTQGPYGPYNGSPPPSPRSRFSFIEVVLVLLIAIVIAGSGFWALTRYGPFATNQPTTQLSTAQATLTSQALGTPTGTVGSGFHLYSSAAMGVQFDMPDGWITQNAASSYGPGVQALSPDSDAGLEVGAILGKTGNNTGAANAGLEGVSSSGSIDVTDGPSQTTFAGATWVQEAADLTRSGVRLHAVIYVGAHGLNSYVLLFLATISTFAAFDAHDFQVTTKSFRFLS